MLKAGKYYVGDLCYVLREENGFDWDDILETTGYLGIFVPGTNQRLDRDETTGYFHYRGVKFFSSSTAYGDGSYYDEEGREYGVDAGLIGCFPLDALPAGADTNDGHVVNFPRDFSCHTVDKDGRIEIGNLVIETSETYEEEDDYDEEVYYNEDEVAA